MTEENLITPKTELQELEHDLNQGLNSALDSIKPRTIDIEQYFSFLGQSFNNDLYKGLTLSDTQLERAKNHMISMKHGTYAATPLICQGARRCPIVHQCFFANRNADGTIDEENSNFPLLRPCPVEMQILKIKIQQYLSQFAEDLNVTITPTVMALVTKLAEIDIYEIRCNAILARGDRNGEGQDLLATTIEAVNENTGDVIKGVKEHPVLAIKDRLSKQRDTVMKQLMATPEARINAQAKLKQSTASNDLASKLTDLAQSVSRIEDNQREIKQVQDGAIEV
jgi:hypothetical protein